MRIRTSATVLLGCLAFASPASAKYLHLNEATPAAQQYVLKVYGQATGNFDITLGHCWRVGPRTVQCGFTDRHSSVDSPTSHVAVITLRGNKLYGHTLAGQPPTDKPHFIRYLFEDKD